MGVIYKATNRINKKSYVGWAKFGMARRRKNHEKNSINNSMLAFHCALRKYGFDAFDWEVLEENDNLKILKCLERFYIKKLRTKVPNGYNLTDGGDGVVNPTELTRFKMGSSWRGKKLPPERAKNCADFFAGIKEISRIARGTAEAREKNRQSHLGKKQTPESNTKRSKTLTGHEVTVETRIKISKSRENLSPETRIGLGKGGKKNAGKVRTQEFKNRVGNYWRGRKRTEENGKNISIGLKQYHTNKKSMDWESCSL